MPDQFRVVALGRHDRTAFACGVEALDRYLKTQASQDARRRVSNCYIAVDANETIAAYYTFAAASIPLTALPEREIKHLPRYSDVPAALIGRLAVDSRFQGRKLGATLIVDAILRARDAAPAIFALLVDAKDETAATFYRRMEFRPFASRPLSFFLPLATAEKLLLGR